MSLRQVDLRELNDLMKGTLLESLGIRFTNIGPDYLEAEMPVDHRTYRPGGILHGGASVALAETLGSVGSNLTLDPKKQDCMGLEINANHIRAISSGRVIGRAEPIHLGRTTQIWEIRIRNEEGKLVSISRLTVAVVAK